MNIYQGSNDPLLFEIDEEFNSVVKFSAILTQYGVIKKSWDLSTIETDINVLVLPLTEVETMSLSRGPAVLTVKVLTDEGRIVIMDNINLKVVETKNNTVLTEV